MRFRWRRSSSPEGDRDLRDGNWLESKGVENVSGMNKGGSQMAGPVKVTMTHAIHSCGILDDGKIIYGGEAAGYVLRCRTERKIYFAGDTNVFSDMALIQELYPPALAFLPIGDLFTMSPHEAAMACRLLKRGQGDPDALRDVSSVNRPSRAAGCGDPRPGDGSVDARTGPPGALVGRIWENVRMTRSILLAILSIAALQAADKRLITATDIYSFHWLADPQISPDGKQVVYTSVKVNAKKDGYDTALFIVPTSGGAPRQLTAGTGRCFAAVVAGRQAARVYTRHSGADFHFADGRRRGDAAHGCRQGRIVTAVVARREDDRIPIDDEGRR